MSIVISGSPETLHAGYNPAYFYANSTNVNEPNFRYIVDIYNLSTGERFPRIRTKPRYGDGLLEVNIQKILSSELAYNTYDFIVNSTDTGNGFINTPSSGFKYGVEFGEEYPAAWEFGDTYYDNGYVGLTGSTLPPYAVGDFIQVTNAAEYIVFEDNAFNSGLVAFTFPSGHPFNVGDTVYIRQDSPYTNPSYEGYATILSATTTLVTIDKPFIQNTPVEGGEMIRNFVYDGLQQVQNITTVTGGYLVTTYQPWINNSPAHTGSTKFNDNRTVQVTGLTSETRYVFNGGQTPLQFINWDATLYDPLVNGFKLLTTIPRDISYPVRLENEGYIDFWSRTSESPIGDYELEINTYDVNNNLIATWTDLDTNVTRTEVMAIPIAPTSLNSVGWNIILNGDFSSTSDWTLFGYTGGITSISGGTLNYYDPVGDGEGLAWQYSALTIGCAYKVTINARNNNFVGVQVGDTNDTVTIVPNGDNGSGFTATFIAQTEDFVIVMSSGYAGECGVNLDDIKVRQLCPIIDCDVDHYTVNVNELSGGTQSETLTFKVNCDCTGRYTNYPISFLDRYGSILPMNFELNSTSNVTITRDMTKNFVGRLSNGAYRFSLGEFGERTFNTEMVEEWTLNSDWISESLMGYMEELFSSPVAYININGNNYSAIVKESTFERKRKNNVKNIRYTITVQLSLDSGIQTG